MKPKYIFVVGGVMSGVGKGIATASIGNILQSKGFRVTVMKIDPYLNVDAGTMNPTEHGEVFVLDDGLETDQDMGHYERFLNLKLSRENYMTNGMVYKTIIDRERSMGYGGRCVDVVPDVPKEIIRRIQKAQKKSKADIMLIEIGGTLGEYQGLLFLEAGRMLRLASRGDVLFVLVSYLPVPNKIGEMKTKPTQYAVRSLNAAGIQPDIIIARSEISLDKKRKEKLADHCNLREEDVISAPDIDSVYEVPVNFENDGLSRTILKKMGLRPKKKDLVKWRAMARNIRISKKPLRIGIVGKYFGTGDFVLSDAYISVIEAIKHACYSFKRKPVIDWLNSEEYQRNPAKVRELKKYAGIIVPGGFGERGVEGKIKAIEFCRKNRIPYFGLCYGMQLLVIEFARNVLGLKGANTTEINRDTKYPVIDIMPEQKKNLADKNFGATMRLGAYPATLKKNTIAFGAYKSQTISERHRHRWEVNPEYIARLEKSGLAFSGTSPNGRLMEIAELPKKSHPFHLGTQFHPEFKSSPLHPHPLFKEFIKSAINKKWKR
ncbi:MAG: CTP synthetase, CTP synthase [Candidatus Moranbacteria bacterium GW2011_GWC1_45_18]|nr:MAG: CTP synthetase [Candidatus Moranbacteria bacterium GW2011_GWC2_40_12]KKT34059.1 MAG: CTP synthetase [Candidatus Moranbacteria bacterium GW2011_GWF2_44_10]KKT69608.1 MAG: CTP synthetase [Candidatus Moranbacteria bacterium GW2011_GWF1_44_4]KKU00115.1 MAG: CTP synthetase, CTP synthase [Candidatus Moranbacteria bacterium GW2011_GWC1_45_18]OGI34790.1 MAG: CTP synthase [Candidatus Moranbacteria bacterium RIFOXYC1_FULL_44_8]HBB37151.1 CTP synthase [Candidatus Moranbacteria bacterium]